METEARPSEALGSETGKLTALLFLAFLIAGGVAIALGLTWYSPLASAVCVGPFLLGFLISLAYYLRTKHVSEALIQLSMDSAAIRPGDVVSGMVELRPERPMRIRSLEAKIWGGESASITEGSAESSVKYTQEAVWLEKTVDLLSQRIGTSMGIKAARDERVQPGSYFYRFEFKIPENAVPSWTGSNSKSACRITVRADVARGLDAIRVLEVPILPMARIPGHVTAFYFLRTGERQSGAPGLEVTINSKEYTPGEVVSGLISLKNLKAERVRELRVSLREVEWAVAQQHRSISEKIIAKATFPPPAVDSQSVPFKIALPPTARPTVSGRISKLKCDVVVRADIALARDLIARGGISVFPQRGDS